MIKSLYFLILGIEYLSCTNAVESSKLLIEFSNDESLELEASAEICKISDFLCYEIEERRCKYYVDLKEYTKESFEMICSLIDKEISVDVPFAKLVDIIRILDRLRLSADKVHQNSVKLLFKKLSLIVITNLFSKVYDYRGAPLSDLFDYSNIVYELLHESINIIKPEYLTNLKSGMLSVYSKTSLSSESPLNILFKKIEDVEYDDNEEMILWFAKASNISNMLYLDSSFNAYVLILNPIDKVIVPNCVKLIQDLLYKDEKKCVRNVEVNPSSSPISSDEIRHIDYINKKSNEDTKEEYVRKYSLDTSCISSSSEDIKSIYSLSGIQKLRLKSKESSIFTFIGIWNLKNLSLLEISNFSVNSADFFYLSGLKNLETLRLFDCKILNTNSSASLDISKPEEFSALRRIELTKCEIDHDSFKIIAHLKRVTKLQCNNVSLGKCNDNLIRNLPNLEHLEFSICDFPNTKFEFLSSLQKLRFLNLSGVKINQEIVSEILKIQSMEKLVLKDCDLTVDLLEQLVNLPNLQYIDIRKNNKFTSKNLRSVVAKCREKLIL